MKHNQINYQINPNTLELEIVKVKRNYFSLLVLGIILMLLGFTSGVKVKTVIEKVPVLLQPKEQECTPQNVKDFIIKMNLKFPKIVYQQVMCESAYLQSPTFKEFNNLLGMENAKSRPTVGTDVGVRWAKYDNWKQSITDYALWQASYTTKISSEEDYYTFLDEVYCSYKLKENAGERYSTRLKRIPYDN
jgi:beta-lactamase class D